MSLPAEACEQPSGAIYNNSLSGALTAASIDFSGPHTLRVCAGVYNETTLLFNSTSLEGIVVEGALLPGETQLDVRVIGGTNDIFDIRVDGVTLRDIEINNGRFGLETDLNATNLLLERVTFNNSSSSTLRLDALGVTVIDLTINNAGASGIVARSSSGIFTSTNLTVNSTGALCISLQGLGPNVLNNTDLNNCGSFGLSIAADGDDTTINDFTVSSTLTNDCLSIAANDLNLSNLTLMDCGGRGLDINVDGGGDALSINNLIISGASGTGILINNVNALSAGAAQLVNFNVSDSGARSLQIVNSSGLIVQDFVLTESLSDAILLNDADNNEFSTGLLSHNSVSGSGDSGNDNGLELVNSDGNTFSSMQIINSFDDGLRLSASINNVFTNVAITNPLGNADDGVVLNASSTGNIFSNISVDAVNDECIDLRGNNTSLTNITLSNCIDRALVANVAGGTDLTLDNIDILSAGDDGLIIQNFSAGSGITANDITILNATDIGMQINTTNGGSYSDLNIQSSGRFGLLLSNADNTTIDVSALEKNIIMGNEDGVQLQSGSQGNNLSDFIVSNSNDDGVIITNSSNNTFSDSEILANGDQGVLLTNSAVGNTISNNIILENQGRGAAIFNNNVSSANVFFDNCFRNTVNVINNEVDAANSFDNGSRGNFWGSIDSNGTGFSESCVDDRVLDDDICDSAYAILGDAASIDNYPLQKCDAFSPQLTITKTSSPVDDQVNLINHKAIPGALVEYTVQVSNASDLRTGMAEDTLIMDNLDNQISLEQSIIWQNDAMIRTAPDYDAGAATLLTDALGDDDAEFDDSPGARNVMVSCGDLNASETCTVEYFILVN